MKSPEFRSYHPLYNIWHNMKARCLKPRCDKFAHYGGRGITMPQAWIDDFWALVADIEGEIGPHPGKGWSLDRIDNDMPYMKENLRWATQSLQTINVRGRKDNATGRKGLHFCNLKHRWVVQLSINGIRRCRSSKHKAKAEAILDQWLAERDQLLAAVTNAGPHNTDIVS